MKTYKDVDVNAMLCDAMSVGDRLYHVPQYARVLLDKRPGRAIAAELLSDILAAKNQSVVNLSELGVLGIFI